MLKRTMAVTLAITFVLAAGTAMAQPCLIGLYVDEAGTQSVFQPTEAKLFDVFAVIHVEATVAGVAYNITVPSGVTWIDLMSYGPSGNGINVQTTGGDTIGLGECAIGFNSQPVVVARYSAIELTPIGAVTVVLGPNVDENALTPVFADCVDNIIACASIQNLELGPTIGVSDTSFGAVKSLYGN